MGAIRINCPTIDRITPLAAAIEHHTMARANLCAGLQEDAARYAPIRSRTAMKRWGRLEHAVGAVMFLASPPPPPTSPGSCCR
jgi:NAD(P)-dependent dehydrogenase (short-subunit alcohol dehydrogenase family)